MIECPNCSGQIIEEAVKCKHCGKWLKSYEEMISDTTNKTSPDFFPIILGIPLLLCLHYMTGYHQTPQIVIDFGLSKGFETMHIKLGYGLGMVLFYAFPVPILFGLISLFIESKRDLFSFSQIVFWSMVFMVALNATVGFLIVPKALKGVNIAALETTLQDTISQRTYKMPNSGLLEVSVPENWVDSIKTEYDGVPMSISFVNPRVPNFHLAIATALPGSFDNTNAIANDDKIKSCLQNYAQTMKSEAIESDIRIQKLKGDSCSGYYFRITSRSPIGKRYKYFTQGFARVREQPISFNIFSNDGQNGIEAIALNIVQSIRLVQE